MREDQNVWRSSGVVRGLGIWGEISTGDAVSYADERRGCEGWNVKGVGRKESVDGIRRSTFHIYHYVTFAMHLEM